MAAGAGLSDTAGTSPAMTVRARAFRAAPALTVMAGLVPAICASTVVRGWPPTPPAATSETAETAAPSAPPRSRVRGRGTPPAPAAGARCRPNAASWTVPVRPRASQSATGGNRSHPVTARRHVEAAQPAAVLRSRSHSRASPANIGVGGPVVAPRAIGTPSVATARPSPASPPLNCG